MMTWKRYGAGVLVAASVLVTGVWLSDTPSKVVRAEYVARAVMALDERQQFAYLTGGSAEPIFPERKVDSFPRWSMVHNVILNGARNLATNTPTSLPAVLWLDPSAPLPESGDYLVESLLEWSPTATNEYAYDGPTTYDDLVEYTWELVSTGSYTDRLFTTATRLFPASTAGYDRWPGTSASNFPLSRCVYESSGSGVKPVPAAGSWWSAVGVSTNSYKYWCETPVYQDIVAIEQVHGSGFNVSTNQLLFTYDGHAIAQSLWITNTAGSATPTAAYWELTSATRETEHVGAARAFASLLFTPIAIRPSWSVQWQTAITVPSGQGPSFSVYVSYNAFAESFTVEFTYYGDISGPSGFTDTWPFGTYIDWSVPEGGAGLVKVVHANSINRNTYWVVVVNPNDTQAIKTSSSAVELATSARTSTEIALAAPMETFPVIENRLIKTNDLWQAHLVLTNLYRSIYIAPWTALEIVVCTNRTDDVADVDSVSGQSTQPAWSLADFMDDTVSLLLTQPGSATIWDGMLYEVFVDATRVDTCSFLGTEDEEWSSNLSCSASYESNEIEAITPYPSEAACASGRVASVTIYLAVRNRELGGQVAPMNWYDYGPTAAGYVLTVNATTTSPEALAAEAFGLPLYPALIPPLPVSPILTLARNDLPMTPSTAIDTSLRLSKIGTYVNPSIRPSFKVGDDMISIPLALAHWQDFYAESLALESAYKLEEYDYHGRLEVTHVIVIVDWQWEAFGPSDYTPVELNTPEWTTGPDD